MTTRRTDYRRLRGYNGGISIFLASSLLAASFTPSLSFAAPPKLPGRAPSISIEGGAQPIFGGGGGADLDGMFGGGGGNFGGGGGGFGGGGGGFGGGGGPFGGGGGNGRNILGSVQFLMMLMALFQNGSNTQQSAGMAVANLNQAEGGGTNPGSGGTKPGQSSDGNGSQPNKPTTPGKPSWTSPGATKPAQKPSNSVAKPGGKKPTVSNPADQRPAAPPVVEAQPPVSRPVAPITGGDGRPTGSFFEKNFAKSF